MERLLDELDAEAHEIRRDRAGDLNVPTLVAVDADRTGKAGADRLETLEIGGAADLHLEDAVVLCATHLVGRAFDRVDANREGGRRAGRLEPEHAPRRLAEALADPIVQRAVDGHARAAHQSLGMQAAHDRLERERIVTQQGGSQAGDLVEHGLGRLAVIIDRGALADADQTVVLQLDDQDWLVRRDAAGDLERLVQGQVLDAGADLHGGNLRHGRTSGVRYPPARPPP